MVLSFGTMGDAIDDELAGADSSFLVSRGTPESTVPLAMIGPTTSVPTGSTAASGGGGLSDFFSKLGGALLGTTASVTAGALTARTPAQLAALQAQQAQAAAASRNQMLLIGGGVIALVLVGAFVLRRRAA